MIQKVILFSQNPQFIKLCNSLLPPSCSITAVNDFTVLSKLLGAERNCLAALDFDCFRNGLNLDFLIRERHHELVLLSARINDRRKLPKNVLTLPFEFKNYLKKFDKKTQDDNTLLSLCGSSPQMEKVRSQVKEASACDYTVLLTGETGTGKSLGAVVIHELSRRRGHKMVTENIASVSPALIESELFGVKKGAFTDAHEDRRGLVLKADKSTLFLDEIGELAYPLQSKLLYCVQTGMVRHVGSDESIHSDVRYIFGTNQNLKEKIELKEFRKDLYFRISELIIHMPPLRERLEDIDELADNWINKQDRKFELSPQALLKLKGWNWPGNVRELENVLARAGVRSRDGFILPEMIEFYGQDLTFS